MNLMDLIRSESFIDPLTISIKVAISATLISLILALLLNYLLFKRSFPGKSIVETVIMLPIVLPPTVVGFLLLILFGKRSGIGEWIEMFFQTPLIFTIYAAITASTIVALPLVYQAIKIGINNVPRDIIEAAQLDGASKLDIFKSIVTPLAKPAILSGLFMAFARAVGEFGATLIFAGNIPGVTQTMPTAIYVAIDNNNMSLAWTFVAVMIMLSLLLMFIVQHLGHNNDKHL